MLLGADPEKLDEIARQFDAAAATLKQVYQVGRHAAHSRAWSGPDAEQFRHQWDGTERARLAEAERMLVGAAKTLRVNATAQRHTSEAQTGTWAAGPGGFDWRSGGHLSEDQRTREAQLKEIAGKSPAEQLAWWNSLTDGERKALLLTSPGMLLAMQGLPPDVHAQANRNAIEDRARSIATKTESTKIEVSGNVKIVQFGADGQIETKTFPDGHVEVTVKAGVNGGVGLKGSEKLDGSIAANGEASATYRFNSKEEADRFTQGLLKAPIPKNGGDYALGALALVTPGGIGTYAGHQVAEYLAKYDGQKTSSVVGGELTGDVKLKIPGVGGVDLHGGAGVDHDFTKHETTAYVEVKASADGSMGPFEGSAGAGGKIAVTYDDQGQIKDMTITGSYNSQSGASGDAGVVSGSSMSGTSGSYSMTIDFSDGANAQKALDLLNGAANGDPAQMARSFASLRDASTIVVQTNATSTSQGGLDGSVVAATITKDTSTVTGIWVKPAHGEYGHASGSS